MSYASAVKSGLKGICVCLIPIIVLSYVLEKHLLRLMRKKYSKKYEDEELINVSDAL